MELGTEEKTILHYAKKIKEYCNSKSMCEKCPLHSIDDNDCYFYRLPYLWPEVDLHDV